MYWTVFERIRLYAINIIRFTIYGFIDRLYFLVMNKATLLENNPPLALIYFLQITRLNEVSVIVIFIYPRMRVYKSFNDLSIK